MGFWLHDYLGPVIQEDNDAFVCVLLVLRKMSVVIIIAYISTLGYRWNTQISTLDDIDDNDSAVNQPSIEILDAYLQYLPKEM